MEDRQSAGLLLVLGGIVALVLYNRGAVNVFRVALGLQPIDPARGGVIPEGGTAAATPKTAGPNWYRYPPGGAGPNPIDPKQPMRPPVLPPVGADWSRTLLLRPFPGQDILDLMESGGTS